MYTVSQYGIDTWEGSLIVEGASGLISQDERH